MPGRVVVDSSVIAAMFFKEEASQRVLSFSAEYDIITLDLAIAEFGNVAWKQVVLHGENRDLASDALEDGLEFIVDTCVVLKSLDLARAAYQIAIDDKISFYDALFVAAAEKEQAPLLTLDKKLFEKATPKRDIKLV